MAEIAHAALVKDRAIIGQIMHPTMFKAAYPVDWSGTEIRRFGDLENLPGYVTNSTYMTYSNPDRSGAALLPNAEAFARQMSLFNLMWRRQSLMYLGFS